jgi:hypothetical protein
MESGVSGGSSSWTCPDAPHRVSGRKTVNRIEMTYLESLTDAEDDRKTTVDGGLGLAGSEL